MFSSTVVFLTVFAWVEPAFTKVILHLGLSLSHSWSDIKLLYPNSKRRFRPFIWPQLLEYIWWHKRARAWGNFMLNQPSYIPRVSRGVGTYPSLHIGGQAEEEGVVGECEGVARHWPHPPNRRTRYRHRDDLAQRHLGGRRNLFARDGCRWRRGWQCRGRRQRHRDAHFSMTVAKFWCTTYCLGLRDTSTVVLHATFFLYSYKIKVNTWNDGLYQQVGVRQH